MAAAEKTTEERLADLETLAAAILSVAVFGAAAAVGDDLPQALHKMADATPGMPESVRSALHAIAAAMKGGGSNGDVHS